MKRLDSRESRRFIFLLFATTLINQAKRHDEAEIIAFFLPVLWLKRCSTFWCFKCHFDFISWHIAQNLKQVTRIESDIQRISCVSNCQLHPVLHLNQEFER